MNFDEVMHLMANNVEVFWRLFFTRSLKYYVSLGVMQRPVKASFSKSSKILRVMKSISRLSKLGGLTLLGNSS